MKKLKGIILTSLLTLMVSAAFVAPQSVGAVALNEELKEEINTADTVVIVDDGTQTPSEVIISDTEIFESDITFATEQPTSATEEVQDESLVLSQTQSPVKVPSSAPDNEQITPLPVEGLIYSNVTSNSITLNWDKSDDVTGYIIYRMDRNTNGKYVRRTMINDNQTTTYTETDLIPSRSYYYQVKAFLYENRTYYYSDPVTIKLGTTPNTVQNLEATTNTKNKIAFKWSKAEGADGYIIYRMDYKSNNQYRQIAAVNSNVIKITNTNLESGRAYYYRVSAYKNIAGTKFIGDYQTLKTATSPDMIKELKVSAQSTTQISINWDTVLGANGYIIYRMDSSTNGQYVALTTLEGNSNASYTDKNLLAGRAYYYRIKPYKTVAGKTFYADLATLKTGTATVTPSFTLKSNNKKITASWTKVSGAEGYTLYLSESKNGAYYAQASTTKESITSKELTPGKTYYVKIAAFNLIDGKRIYSDSQTTSIACKNLVEGYNLGDTFVEISIKDQRMWFYKNGVCLASTPVVTGTKGIYDTQKGVFSIGEKKSPARLVGSNWDIYVNYWIDITDSGIGIHDTPWRTSSEYGGNTYTYDGSDGSIHTPYSQVKKIYEKCPTGTPVVIY
ncbi:MAG: fibronectin type III domain-containing protein [Acutalibacteraceae bacterium]|nr:fibronectin type III domain-containing protein [Acutalibacteraceae bacterium]